MRSVFLTDTVTRSKREFTPLKPGHVTIYACGPTVYDYAHIGNWRAFLFEDILRRMFIEIGYKVHFVMNITDVGHLTSDADEGEDKMLKGARREKKTVWDIARFYTDAFKRDAEALHVLEPDVLCTATDHINEMIELVKRLEEKGFTYVAEGNVYFDVKKFATYGAMAKLKLDELQPGARVQVDTAKRNPQDFVLWFTKSKFADQDMKWDSPWGRGYPGWHIECSAMSMKYCGEEFDIHCGGIDHISVHHTNEIAQSEGATGKRWVHYWLHSEFLVINKEKMSKSKGNLVPLHELEKQGFEALDYRYLVLGAHYRSKLDYSLDAMEGAKQSRLRLCKKVFEFREDDRDACDPKDYKEAFLKAVADDLNTPLALATVWAVVRDADLTGRTKLELLYEFDKVLGLGLKELQEESIDIPEEIQQLLDEREKARASKDFARADELRDHIQQKGYVLDDTDKGVKVRRA